MTALALVSEEALVAAGGLVDLVEPVREKNDRVPESKRDAHQHLERLLLTCRFLAAFDVVPEDGWAAAQRTAEDLLDFIFQGHPEHDPRHQASRAAA
jgi:hypothetical protein